MKVNAKDISKLLNQASALLEIAGDNSFRASSFSAAARTVDARAADLDNFLEQVKNSKVKGIGEALGQAIVEIYETGELKLVDELEALLPNGLSELLKLPGLGAKKVKTLWKEVSISNMQSLEQACLDGSLSKVKGFGKKTQENLLAGIEKYKTYQSKSLFSDANKLANKILEVLGSGEVSGELRRKCEVINCIEIVSTQNPKNILSSVEKLGGLLDIKQKNGQISASTEIGCSLLIHCAEQSNFTKSLFQTTGSKGFIQELGDIPDSNYKNEAEIFEALSLNYIEPELREAQRIEPASELVVEKDIKGIVHAHTTYSDGQASLREMALAVKNQGYQYFGVSDHSQSAAYAGGLREDKIKKQHEEIDLLNQELAPFRIFKGIESDILKDGSLDYPDRVLETFDFIIASVHSGFSMAKEEQTKRLVTAIKNPHCTILGHMTGRLLLRREGYDLDAEEVLDACAKHNVAIELNANPRRFDIDWRLIPLARKLGIPIPINPDAHSIEGISDTIYGVGVARKGGLAKSEVLNCLSVDEFAEYINAR